MDKTENAESYFILGEGKRGTFTDIKINISIDSKPSLEIVKDTQNQDKEIISKISIFFNNWLDQYHKNEISLKIIVTHIGTDNTGRQFAADRAVNNVMHEALPKIGVKPPQIFGL